MNKADSERLSAFLENKKLKEVQDFMEADLVVINTCSIRQSAEDRLYGLVHQIRKKNPKVKIVVTGCLSRRQDVHKRLADKADLFMPINEMTNIFELLAGREVKVKLSLDEVRLLQGEKYLSIIPKYQSKFSAYVPIGNGCNNFCSYCVVPYARGREVYRPTAEIIKEVKALIKNGYKEITLIAQNVNSYHDKKINFPKLLEAISKIPGDFWIRFSSSHPKDVSPELIKVIGANLKICPHLHLAVQSGDNKILAAMNRKYKVEHFIDLVIAIRRARPGIAITTDVIVGFPGETRAQFLNTVKLFKKIKFDLVYISRYSPRPGTVSYQMKDNVSREEKKRREFELDSILKKGFQDSNALYIGKEVRVLLEGINKKNKYYGKTGSYKMMLVNPSGKINDSLVGTFVNVLISGVGKFGFEGDIVDSTSLKPKVIAILGPTATGKTALGVKLAKAFNGEIISADSRQVYRGMDIGTGKDLAEYNITGFKVPYHLIDIINPNTKFNLARYQKLTNQAILDILRRNRLPIIVGGTGLYLQAVIDNYQLAEIKTDSKKRVMLEKRGAKFLFKKLSLLKPEFAAQLNNSDKNNARRLARYLEISENAKTVEQKKADSPFDFLILGVDIDDEAMRNKIEKRLDRRLEKEGMIEEVEKLRKSGVSFKRLIGFGLEYKFISYFLQEKMSQEEMRDKLAIAIYRFAKHQKTWFRRWEKQGRKIEWISDIKEAREKIKKFIN